MLSVAAMVSGGFCEPGTETVTVPVHVCAVVNPVVFTPITSWVCWPGCVAVTPTVGGNAFRNPLQFVVLVATTNGSGGPLLESVTVWFGGAACPSWKLKVTEG